MKILLIDDHALFRYGLQELLERRGLEVVAAVGSGEEGVEAAARTQPDVILLDMRMPEVSGLQVLQRMRAMDAAVPVVILTTSCRQQDVIEALQGGARGYLLKDMEPDELLAALEAIVNGSTVVAPELTDLLARAVQGESPSSCEERETLFTDLTPREREILCLVAEGQSNKVVARNLGISDGTVKLHVKAILRKLGIHSRVEAAVMAVEYNLCQRE